MRDSFRFQNVMKPDSLIHQSKVESERPGRRVPRRIPGQNIVLLPKGFDLFIKKTMIRGQTREKDQRPAAGEETIYKIMDRTAFRHKRFLIHITIPPALCADRPSLRISSVNRIGQ